MRIGIIGSGISGMSVANMLKDGHDVTVFEKAERPGGLIKCDRIKDCLFHKVGGHVFNSRNPRVSDWFWSFFDRDQDFVSASRKAKVLFNNQIIGYPIENHLYHFESHLIGSIVDELLELQKQPVKPALAYEHFEAFLEGNFGATLYEQYFRPYNEKIWKTDLSTVPMGWLEGKLPMPNLNEIIRSNILREEEGKMVHSTFFYPKEGGSQFIVDRLKQGIEIINDTTIDQIAMEDGQWLVAGKRFDRLIYTGDLRVFPEYGKRLMKSSGVDVAYLEQLKANGTSNLFCETDGNDMSWLYIPQNFTLAHRIIYTGNFSESNNRGSDRLTCVVEFSGKVAEEVMIDEIKKLPGNLTPLAHNYEPNSYVIQDSRTREEVNAAKDVLKDHGIHLLGRFAEWEYYNMDKAIEAAFALYDGIDGK